MGYVAHVRAPALPTGREVSLPPSPLRLMKRHAAERGDDAAFLVLGMDGPETRSWSEVAQTVERAAAGLIRSGLRPDQVVVSLLPDAHPYPEFDIALRAVGAVVIHVSAAAGADDLGRELAGVDARLIVSESEDDLTRLAGVALPAAEVFAFAGGLGWSRLQKLGAERLVMDPDAVTRMDRIVDPQGCVPRILPAGGSLGRIVTDPDAEVGALGEPAATILLAGDGADPLLRHARETHLSTGNVLAHVGPAADLPAALAHVQPTALVLATDMASGLGDLIDSSTLTDVSSKRRRARAAGIDALQTWCGGRLAQVTAPDLAEQVRSAIWALEVDLATKPASPLPAAELPVPAPVVVGLASDLPRRSRSDPDPCFQLEADVPPDFDEEEASAFALPSMPLIGGESFLDQMLLAQAKKAGA